MKRHPRHSKRVTATKRWRLLRWQVLERDGFRCRACGARGRLELDHVEPVRDAPARAFDPANLQSLCASCHTRKTRIEAGHPPLSEPRRAWREAVSELEAAPHRAVEKESTCLIP